MAIRDGPSRDRQGYAHTHYMLEARPEQISFAGNVVGKNCIGGTYGGRGREAAAIILLLDVFPSKLGKITVRRRVCASNKTFTLHHRIFRRALSVVHELGTTLREV